MKKIIILAAILAMATTVHAAGSLCRDANGVAVQGHCPDGANTETLTVNSSTINAANNVSIGIYSPVDCQIRVMPTSSKAGTVAETIPGGAWVVRVVNPNSTFFNRSGCTNGKFNR